ncbi:hypothetical protein BST92_01770 [Nonlabens arenilitoris]|uniref:Aldose 1-epimerase n=1 Tax=Nonlabens arenilitoris TaxID=1217969 RepID=A0A2S7U844_9FLAO|nr:aldose 1-epimerase [Nonlabens arenilitoris]PQJ30731.1 hypothetical protein BST92_01770 [Nonlabens arenilitoris]
MYIIEHDENTDTNQVILENYSGSSQAILLLNEGARVQRLKLDNISLIEDLSPLKYADTYASSVLFPFANRIKDGSYSFNGKQYQLDINHESENNAIHGFIYNKEFEIVNRNTSEYEASVTLEYEENQWTKGFPYTYKVQLIYTLRESGLDLKVVVKNTDSTAFPFTIGWHPYFTSKDLYNSTVQIECDKKVILGDRLITTGTEVYPRNENIQIKNNLLDDCFILNSNKIEFFTPEYDMQIISSSPNTYLQLYTPPKTNRIAIEPTTGISDSFNNKIGLEVLGPDKSYTINWNILLKSKH